MVYSQIKDSYRRSPIFFKCSCGKELPLKLHKRIRKKTTLVVDPEKESQGLDPQRPSFGLSEPAPTVHHG